MYLDYGFDLDRLNSVILFLKEDFTFGYIETYISVKWIQLLIQLFSRLENNYVLRIFRGNKAQNTAVLHVIAIKTTSTDSIWY